MSLNCSVFYLLELEEDGPRGKFREIFDEIKIIGSLSKDDLDDSENVIGKCNFAFLQ